MPSQQSLREFVGAMDEAGFLKRINDEIRVDQIPRILEEHPTSFVNRRNWHFGKIQDRLSNHRVEERDYFVCPGSLRSLLLSTSNRTFICCPCFANIVIINVCLREFESRSP
jgi:hypothetical protein